MRRTQERRDEVLETYRWRWQAGIHLKRLKSILDLGELPKKNPAASEAWLNGKIMVALLTEAFIGEGSFPPGEPVEYQAQPMARNGVCQFGIEG